MAHDFSSLFNHHEREVFSTVMEMAPTYAANMSLDEEALCDIACVALNRLPPRYIRHEVDFLFYLTERERQEISAAVHEAVTYAFNFVEARTALRSRNA